MYLSTLIRSFSLLFILSGLIGCAGEEPASSDFNSTVLSINETPAISESENPVITETPVIETDTISPSAPGNLRLATGSPTRTSVQLVWDSSIDNVAVSGYKIIRDNVLLDTTTEVGYTDTSVSAGTTYQYYIIAYDAKNNISSGNTLTLSTLAPILMTASNDTYSTPYETALNGNLTINDTQSPNSPTSWALVAQATSGTVNINSNGSFTYTPANGFSGNVTFTYRMQDSLSNFSNTATVSVNVQPQPPILMTASNDTYSTPYETALNGNLTINDTQSLNTPTSWALVTQATSGTANINSNGSFTYTPANGFSGNVTFTYRMQDSLSNFSNTATVSVMVQPQQVETACETIYENAGGFTPVTSRTVTSIPNISKPAKGSHFLDSNFGTCIVRVSDHNNDSNTIANRIVPDYSRRQVFNADQSRMLLLAGDGYWHLYDANNYNHIRRVSLQGDSVEFQWHPTDPDLLYRMPFNGGRRIYLHDLSDVTDNTSSIVADFTNVNSINGYPGLTSINQIWPNAMRFLTGEEGSPSADGRYWALMAMSNDFNTQYGMIVYDLQTDTITGVYDYSTDGGGIGGPNNITMSPSGTHVVALWNPPACDGQNGRPSGIGTLNNPCGSMAFNRDFTQATGLAMNGEHGDTATDINGRDVYVGIEYQNRGAIEIIDLETGNLVADIETNVWVGGAVHISGRAYNKPGWVVISHYGGNPNTWYNQEIFLAKLDANPVIVSLAKHQSNPSDYWAQPHATISRDASKVVWGSNWGGSVSDIDTYMISLPNDTLDNL